MKNKILKPSEWKALKENLIWYYQIIFDAMLHTGLRPDSEFWNFVDHPEWYENGIIFLPSIPGIQQARTVRLSIEGRNAVQILIKTISQYNRKGRQNMRDALHRAALGITMVPRFDENGKRKLVSRPKIMDDVSGLSAETFRRTLTAWLVACFPGKKFEILRSMGMDEEHFSQYTNNHFGLTRKDVSEARKLLKGW